MKRIYKQISAAIIAIALTIMLLPISENVLVSADSAIWDGTTRTAVTPVGDVYSVGNGAELAWIAQQVNGGNGFSGKTIELTADILLNSGIIDENSTTANTWTAIGCYNFNKKYFSGTFDGKGHTVSGIYFNNTAQFDKNCYQGLFGLSNGTIKNVGVINSYIKGYFVIGGIVGENYGGTVTNCYNEGTITGTGPGIGGVAGEIYGGTVTNCYNEGTITGTDTNNIGGVAGLNDSSTISNCYNSGAVSGNSGVGGVVGQNHGNTLNCYNTGAVGSNDCVGGVVGQNNGNTLNCYNTGAVGGNDCVGGIVGYTYSGTITNNYYYGCNVGISNKTDEAGKATPFAKIAYNPLGTAKTTSITEQTTTDINTAWSTALGSDFAVAFSDTYSSSDTGVATISGTTITGVSAGTSTISGRTLTITQNELASSGFTGGTKTISVPISMSLTVIALVDAVSPIFDTDLSGTDTYTKDTTATALTVSATVTDTGAVSYQWYKNTSNSTTGGTEISGATNATYTPPTDTAGTSYYYVIATNTNNSATGTKTATTTSGVKTIVVNALVNAAAPTFDTDLSGTDTYTKDTTATALTVSATVTDMGAVSYQWYKNTSNSTTGGTEISGATSETYTPPTDTAGTSYYYAVII